MTGGQNTNPGARAAQPGLYQAGNGHCIADDARSVTLMLRGRWHGRYGSAPCPCCQAGRKDQNALTIGRSSSGRLLAHCKRSNCSFTAILAAAGLSREHFNPDPQAALRYEREARAEALARSIQAVRIWSETQPIMGTAAERYLASRGLVAPSNADLRFHPHCFHGPSRSFHPALIAAVVGGDPAIHRTFLKPDGSGKAEIESPKLALGATAGHAVRLLQGDPGMLFVAEGIESALSIPKVWTDHRFDWASVWATLSASGMRSLKLPEKPGALCVFADGDTAGRSAAAALAERACALGWQVRIVDPGDGRDANDMLRVGEVTP
jgi:hypothetical protein